MPELSVKKNPIQTLGEQSNVTQEVPSQDSNPEPQNNEADLLNRTPPCYFRKHQKRMGRFFFGEKKLVNL